MSEDHLLIIEIKSRFLTLENGDGTSYLVEAAFEDPSHLGHVTIITAGEGTFSYAIRDKIIKRRPLSSEAVQLDVEAGKVFGSGFYRGTGFLERVNIGGP